MNPDPYKKEVQSDCFFDNDAVYICYASAFIMYAAIGVSKHIYRGSFDPVVMKYTLILIETFYQTIFTLYLKRFEGKCYKKLYFVLIFLLSSNMITWIYVQFWMYYISYSNSNEVFGPLHPAARHILYNFLCLYKFLSFIYLYKFYKQEGKLF